MEKANASTSLERVHDRSKQRRVEDIANTALNTMIAIEMIKKTGFFIGQQAVDFGQMYEKVYLTQKIRKKMCYRRNTIKSLIISDLQKHLYGRLVDSPLKCIECQGVKAL